MYCDVCSVMCVVTCVVTRVVTRVIMCVMTCNSMMSVVTCGEWCML